MRSIIASMLLVPLAACSVDGAVSAPAQGCRQTRKTLPQVGAWRAQIVVLVDSRFEAPGGIDERFARLERLLRTGDRDGDGKADLLPLVEVQVETGEAAFDRPLQDLLEPHLPPGYSRYDYTAVVLITTGDPEPALSEGVAELVRRQPLHVVLAGGVPAEHVDDNGSLHVEETLSDPRMSAPEALCGLPGGAPVEPSPNLARLWGQLEGAADMVSLCASDYGDRLAEPIGDVAFSRLLPGPCFPQPASKAGDGRIGCTMYETPGDASPYACDDLPGRVPAPTADDPRRCEVTQRVPPATGEPAEPGWFADRSSFEWEQLCGHDVLINFTQRAYPLPGTRWWLECAWCAPLHRDASTPDGG